MPYRDPKAEFELSKLTSINVSNLNTLSKIIKNKSTKNLN